MSSSVTLRPLSGPVRATIPLASSKSESNRALILNALAGFQGNVSNLSTARDTQTLRRLLHDDSPVADVLDAGTTMRFLTAYFAVTSAHKTLTGTPRMQERPIGLLVDALRALGADIRYVANDGFPPLNIGDFRATGRSGWTIPPDVSSQFISALLMIAPRLTHGLTLTLDGPVGSRPYIEMTLAQMAHFGVTVQADWTAQTLRVPPATYQAVDFAVESDWSGASYWYSVVALSPDPDTRVTLLGLKAHSLQGDSAVARLMEPLGVRSEFTAEGVVLTKTPAQTATSVDFTDCPDLAQTLAVCCGALGVALTLTGIESLKIKETDRVAALQAELPKIGAELVEVEPNTRYLVRRQPPTPSHQPPAIETYDDHRMAMAFAPVAMRQPITILEPGVVAKSYPSFWDDMARVVTVEK